MKRKYIITGLIAIVVIIGSTYFAPGKGGSGKDHITENDSREIAKEFVKNSPTYVFDGFDLKSMETLYPEITGHPNLYTFLFEFESRHGGYGDRTGQQLLEVITPHEAHVTVENGEVIKAVLDSKWDMIDQEFTDEGETT